MAFKLRQEKMLTLLGEPMEDPDANQLLQLACGLIVCVWRPHCCLSLKCHVSGLYVLS